MKLRWQYTFTYADGQNENYLDGPIYATDSFVYVATTHIAFPREVQADDLSKRNCTVEMHRVDLHTGLSFISQLDIKSTEPSSNWTFIPLPDQLLFYCGSMLCIHPFLENLTEYSFEKGTRGIKKTFLVIDDLLIYDQPVRSLLYAYDTRSHKKIWQLSMKSLQSYCIGRPVLQDNKLYCFGADALNRIDQRTGVIEERTTLPRIRKLSPPIPWEGDILYCYSNVTNGGVLRYSPSEEKILWKFSKKFEVASPTYTLPHVGDTLVWTKGGTELIGIQARTGKMLWSKATKPWLYTNIRVAEDRLVYGTSGRDGFLTCVNPEDGQTLWELYLKNGCAYFGRHNNTVVTGDLTGQLLQIDVHTGKIVDRLQIPFAVLGGNITMQGNSVLTMGWNINTETTSLLCVELEE